MKSKKLGLLTTKIGSGITPKGGSSVYQNKGTYLIRSQNIYNDRFEKNGIVCISEAIAKQMKGVEVKENDVLINITGDSVARVFIIPNEFLPARVNQHVCILRTNSELDSNYLYYFLLEKNTQNHLLSLARSGGTRNALTKEMLENLEIRFPEYDEQVKITKYLNMIKNMIELNKKKSIILERLVQTVFKSWFIDFEFPDEKNKPYKSSGGKMVDSEMGKIPEGWTIQKLKNLVNLEIGGDWGKDTPNGNLIPVICLRGTDLQALKESGYSPDAPVRYVKGNSRDRRVISGCDILIATSGIGPIGRTLYCSEAINKIYDFPLIYSNFCKRLTAASHFHAMYIEKKLELIYKSNEISSYITGTSIPNLDLKGLLEIDMLIPHPQIINAFGSLMQSKYFDLFNKQNLILTKIRDMLLPKLMSGQIKIQD